MTERPDDARSQIRWWQAWSLAWRLTQAPVATRIGLGLCDVKTPTATTPWLFTLVWALGTVLALWAGLSWVGLYGAGFSFRYLPLAALQHSLLAVACLVLVAMLLSEAARFWAPRFGTTATRAQAQSATLSALAPAWLWGHTLVWPLLWWLWPVVLGLCVWQLHCSWRLCLRPTPTRAPAYTATNLVSITLLAALLLLARCDAVLPLTPPLPPFPWSPEPAGGLVQPPLARKTASGVAAVADPSGGGGHGGSPVAPPDNAQGSALVLSPTSAASATADLQRWVDSGKPNEPITRTVLQDLLPGAIDGFERRITESYAHTAKDGGMRQVLTSGALARVENVAKTDRGRYLNLTIEDLHGHGTALATKLLDELANTGGQVSLDEGRTQRQISATDDTITVQECFTPLRQCRLEVLIGQRYHLRGESGQLPLTHLQKYVAQVDMKTLLTRARAAKPIE